MAYARPRRHGLPFAALALQQVPDRDIQVGAHTLIIAKFCASYTQHFAHQATDSGLMNRKSLNQSLALNLERIMRARNLSARQLGQMTGLAPNTIGNYLKATGDQFTSKGKERSAKLTEVQRLADALNVDPLHLLFDQDQLATVVASWASAVLETSPPRPAVVHENPGPPYLPSKRVPRAA